MIEKEGAMEPAVQKSLERVISQRAMQMSNSSSCKIWVVGFACGICFSYVFVAAIISFRNSDIELVYSAPEAPFSHNSSTANLEIKMEQKAEGIFTTKHVQKFQETSQSKNIHLLYSAWSAILEGTDGREPEFLKRVGLNKSSVPPAPHFEDCEYSTKMHQQLDRNNGNSSFPSWSIWRGHLIAKLFRQNMVVPREQRQATDKSKTEGAYPPWIIGSDEDNFPLTRRVQRDLWIHQHPVNCNAPDIRFLVADWETIPGFGMGAQFAGMSGLFAIAVNERRVLVTNFYNRADHDGCQGSSRSHWSCYFFPETSTECSHRALELMLSAEAWENGVITVKENYTSKDIWAGTIPRIWGTPWIYMQPTTEIDGSLIMHHRKMDRRWWRAQAIRYLMRFQSHYTCSLLNEARHAAFGLEAAKLVITSLASKWPKVDVNKSQSGIEQFVWSNSRPWVPHPFLSMHVRMGDKAVEMKIVGFEKYMDLAGRVRKKFPNLGRIWLSTEMQEVIDKSRIYTNWNFYYTNVTRQVGNSSMASYETSLGRERSTNYPLVNFMMAAEADFFVGALGSTWCFLIDGMRNTGGKVMAGYLSVNKDRFW